MAAVFAQEAGRLISSSGGLSSNAVRIAWICSGVVPQQPPMICSARLAEGEGIIAKIFRPGGVHDPPANPFRPAGIGLHREKGLRHGGFHLPQNAQHLGWSFGAVDADHICAGLVQPFGGFLGRVSQRVRSSRVKVTEAITGSPQTCLAAFTASRISYRSLIVSMIIRSTPQWHITSICSAKTWRASSAVTWP